MILFLLPLCFDYIISPLTTNLNCKIVYVLFPYSFRKVQWSFSYNESEVVHFDERDKDCAHRDRWRHPCLVLRCSTSLKFPPRLLVLVVCVMWFLEVDTVSYSVLFHRYSLPTCFHRTSPTSQHFEWKLESDLMLPSTCTWIIQRRKPTISISAGILIPNLTRKQ